MRCVPARPTQAAQRPCTRPTRRSRLPMDGNNSARTATRHIDSSHLSHLPCTVQWRRVILCASLNTVLAAGTHRCSTSRRAHGPASACVQRSGDSTEASLLAHHAHVHHASITARVGQPSLPVRACAPNGVKYLLEGVKAAAPPPCARALPLAQPRDSRRGQPRVHRQDDVCS